MRIIIILFILSLYFNQLYSQTKKLFLVAGQSNAKGRGDSLYSESCIPGTAFEFNNKNGLIHLKDPVGFGHPIFQPAKSGSAWPAFAKRYNEISGDTIIIIPVSRGGTALCPEAERNGWGTWDSTDIVYYSALNFAKRAMTNTGLEISGIIWLQGEFDGTAINDSLMKGDNYKIKLTNLINRFRRDLNCKIPFYIIKVGYNFSKPYFGYREIRKAQQFVADSMSNVFSVYDSTIYFNSLGWISSGIHYKQTGLNHLGKRVAENIYEISMNTSSQPAPDLGNDTIVFYFNPIKLDPGNFLEYYWSTGETTRTINVVKSGNYYVTVKDSNYCFFTDSIYIKNQFEVSKEITLEVFSESKTKTIRVTRKVQTRPELSQNNFEYDMGNEFVEIFDWKGNKFYSKQINSSGINTGLSIPAQNLKSGLYILNVYSQGSVVSTKFIIDNY